MAHDTTWAAQSCLENGLQVLHQGRANLPTKAVPNALLGLALEQPCPSSRVSLCSVQSNPCLPQDA